MNAVIVENIIKTYGKKEEVTALNDISFEVSQGELFGIIGPDGAGKTSLFRILTTLLLADSGKAMIDGYDVVKDYKAIRKRVGYMPGRFSLYPDLSVEEVQLALDYCRENPEEIETVFRREDEARERLRAAPAVATT